MDEHHQKPAWRDVDPWPETRHTLLDRLRAGGRNSEWEELVKIYGPLVLRVGLRSGLTEDEARDAMQETMTDAVRQLQEGRYERSRGRFRTWLRQLAHWRIADRFRQRLPGTATSASPDAAGELEPPEGFGELEDPAGLGAFDQMWDEEWVVWRLEAALERIQRRVDPRHFQIYSALVRHGRPVEQVMEMFKLTPDAVYQIKHRVGELAQEVLAKLDREWEGD